MEVLEVQMMVSNGSANNGDMRKTIRLKRLKSQFQHINYFNLHVWYSFFNGFRQTARR
jgi:hypothetical protein